MGVRIVEISVSEHIGQAGELLREHWAETGFDFELAPDIALLTRMEAAGVFFVVAAFDDDDKIVGYSAAFVTPHHFNPAVVVCSTTALFVLKAYRERSVGAKLIRETERIAKVRGAHRITWNTRAGTGLAQALATRGYQTADVLAMKVL